MVRGGGMPTCVKSSKIPEIMDAEGTKGGGQTLTSDETFHKTRET